MPELLSTATPFSPDELREVDRFLPSSVLEWAEARPFIGQPDRDNRRIRDIATFHALFKAWGAQSRLSGFREAVSRGYDLNALHEGELLKFDSPKGLAGKAAGQLAVAKLLTRWYDLQAGDFSGMAAQDNIFFEIFRGIEGLQEAVCNTPQLLGITTFGSHEVFMEAQWEVEAVVVEHGPAALEPYVAFPEFPIE